MHAHDPHVTRSTRVVGKRSGRNSYCGKNPPHLPTHRSGPGPTTCCAYVWPRLLSVYKSRGSAFDPFTCAQAVRASRHGHAQTWQEREAGEEPKPQNERSNNKDQGHEDQMGEAGFPGKDPCRGSLSGPGKTLAGAARPHQLSEPPLSPPMLNKCIGTGLGRHLRGGMQIFVKT